MYNKLIDQLGEADIYNIDALYSDSVNVNPADIDVCLADGDTSHSYYVEWSIEPDYRIGIEFDGVDSVLPTSTSIVARFGTTE